MNAVSAIKSLPTIGSARLPTNYEAAKQALAECQNLDECKDWADKAAALASYAKQSHDVEMERQAQRIRARAVRRAGELLSQIQAQSGGDKKSDDYQGMSGHTLISRAEAAREAGMSKHQQVQAVRIAHVPQANFERQIESANPKPLKEIAQQGIQPRPRPVVDLQGRDPEEFKRAMHFIGTFEHFARELAREDIDASLASINASERVRLREAINRIDAIHDQIMTRI